MALEAPPQEGNILASAEVAQEQGILFKREEPLPKRRRESTRGRDRWPSECADVFDAFVCGPRAAQRGQNSGERMERQTEVTHAGDDEREVARGEENDENMNTGGGVLVRLGIGAQTSLEPPLEGSEGEREAQDHRHQLEQDA